MDPRILRVWAVEQVITISLGLLTFRYRTQFDKSPVGTGFWSLNPDDVFFRI